MMKSGFFFALALALVSSAVAQPRQTESPLQTEQVYYADLNLNSAANQATLRHRIELAAGHVCDRGGMADMEDFIDATACFRVAYRDGLLQMRHVLANYGAGATLAAAAHVTVERK